jgi:phage terminase small subunit
MTETNLVDDRETLALRFPELRDKQLSFVAYYVATGGKGTQSAKAAGYAAASAHVEAHRLLQLPKIIKAIAELSVQRLGAALPGAVATIERLSQKAKSEYVQLEASKDLLDRAGLSAPKRVHVGGDLRVTFDMS